MKVSVSDAKGQLTDLVRRAESGEEVLLTRHGQVVARIAPARVPVSPESKRMLFERIQREGAARATAGPGAARSQDFLYDENGLPK